MTESRRPLVGAVLVLPLVAALGCGRGRGDDGASWSLPGATFGDASGTYTIASSSNPGGGAPYHGTAAVARTGPSYSVAWTITGSKPYRGVAIPTGDVLAVGWGMGADYGVVVYKVAGGTLRGKWATATTGAEIGSETLEGPPGVSGTYKITSAFAPGTGKSYGGSVVIQPRGAVLAMEWKISDGSGYKGVGILEGDTLVVGWGTAGQESGVVKYKVSGATLSGKWATPGGSALGSEVLRKN